MIIYKNKILPHIFKCAGTSVAEACRKDIKNVQYFSYHEPIHILQNKEFSYAADYEKLTLVRNPYSFYRSWYNFNNKLSYYTRDPLTKLLLFSDKKIIPFDKYLNNILNPRDVLKNKLIALKEETMIRPFWFRSFHSNLDENPFYEGESFYQWCIRKLIDFNTKTFRLEDELNDFLKAASINSLPQLNISRNIFDFNETQKEKIFEKDEVLFERFGY